MPETDLERVARAIDPLSWKIIDEHTSDNPSHPADLRLRIRMFNQAAAVLQALLTPSEGMIEAAARAVTNYDDPNSWEKMYETLGDGEQDGWARSRGVEMPCRVEARDSIRAALTAAIQFALNTPQETDPT